MEQPEDIQESATPTPESVNTGEITAPELETSDLLVDDNPSETEEIVDEEEVEFEGDKYKLPKKLKDAFLRQADYTQKTQQVAEQRKAIEAEREQFVNLQKIQQEYIAEVAGVTAIDQQIAQYQEIDWQKLADEDPVQAMKLDRALRTLQEKKYSLVNGIQQKQQHQSLQMQQETARRLQEGRVVLEREIKGWSPGNEIDLALEKYGKDLGIKELGGIVAHVPQVGVALHKAYLYDQLVKKQQQKPAPVEANVVTKVGASNSGVKKTPDQMTDREFAQWRHQQIKARR